MARGRHGFSAGQLFAHALGRGAQGFASGFVPAMQRAKEREFLTKRRARAEEYEQEKRIHAESAREAALPQARLMQDARNDMERAKFMRSAEQHRAEEERKRAEAQAKLESAEKIARQQAWARIRAAQEPTRRAQGESLQHFVEQQQPAAPPDSEFGLGGFLRGLVGGPAASPTPQVKDWRQVSREQGYPEDVRPIARLARRAGGGARTDPVEAARQKAGLSIDVHRAKSLGEMLEKEGGELANPANIEDPHEKAVAVAALNRVLAVAAAELRAKGLDASPEAAERHAISAGYYFRPE